MTTRMVFGVLLLGAAVGSSGARAAGTTTAASCPGWVEHMRRAQVLLAKGNRKAAIAELRRAKDASDACAPEPDDGEYDELARRDDVPAT